MHFSGISSIDEVINLAIETYSHHFKEHPDVCSYAPGRVNLIGEHTDYNEGFVLPMALPLVTVMVGKQTGCSKCNLITICSEADEPKEIIFQIPAAGQKIVKGKPMWANYVKGVMANFPGKLKGFNAVIATNVPVGGGLSSSAALEVAAYSFLERFDNTVGCVDTTDKARFCQKAEHEYAGMPCGIMDQFVSFHGKKDHALLLDCRSLEYHLIKLEDPNATVLITNTNIHHKLADGQYSNRKIQCETAVKILGIASLRDATFSDLEKHKAEMDDEVYRRAYHVITEIQRTLEAALLLQDGDHYARLGELMYESHESLRVNYDVSCAELDACVNAAKEVEGVYGSRMTGGGFGGCTVTLLKTEAVDAAMAHIKGKHANSTFYVCRPGDGAKNFQLSVSLAEKQS